MPPDELTVREGDADADGGCNVYGCPLRGKVWVISFGRVEVRACRAHARRLRALLPRS